MKSVLWAVAAAVVGFGSSHYLRSVPSPAPEAVAPVPAPAPAAPVSDSYYLLSYFSTSTPTGVIGWTAGQEVHLDTDNAREDGMVTVTDGGHTAVIPPSLLTQDRRLADMLSRQDDIGQTQSGAFVAAQHAITESREMAVNMASAATRVKAEAERIASTTIGTYHSRLRQPSYPASGSSEYGYTSYYEYVPIYISPSTLIIESPLASASYYNPPLPGTNYVAFPHYAGGSAAVVSPGVRTPVPSGLTSPVHSAARPAPAAASSTGSTGAISASTGARPVTATGGGIGSLR